jgi:hypothetical protein
MFRLREASQLLLSGYVYAHLFNPSNPKAATRLENTIFYESGHKMVTNENSK